jgi:hypothetical protein
MHSTSRRHRSLDRRGEDLARRCPALRGHCGRRVGLALRHSALSRDGISRARDGAGEFGDFAADAANWHGAGANGLAIDMHGAGTANRHAAPLLWASDAEFIAECPEQGHLGFDIEFAWLAIDRETHVELLRR